MMGRFLAVLCAVILTLPLSDVEAQADPCSKYYGKGYCTDYVNSKIGERIRGDADRWPSNVQLKDVGAGDVAIFRSRKHVAFIEAVTKRNSQGVPTSITISEMNWGPADRSAPKECWVTTNFNRVTRREISTSGLDFYRPKRKGSVQQSKPAQVTFPIGDPGGTQTTTPQYPQ
jgi:hypothetical protein